VYYTLINMYSRIHNYVISNIFLAAGSYYKLCGRAHEATELAFSTEIFPYDLILSYLICLSTIHS